MLLCPAAHVTNRQQKKTNKKTVFSTLDFLSLVSISLSGSLSCMHFFQFISTSRLSPKGFLYIISTYVLCWGLVNQRTTGDFHPGESERNGVIKTAKVLAGKSSCFFIRFPEILGFLALIFLLSGLSFAFSHVFFFTTLFFHSSFLCFDIL